MRKRKLRLKILLKGGSLGDTAVGRLPSAQVVTAGSRDLVPHRASCREACVSASLSVSLTNQSINQSILEKKRFLLQIWQQVSEGTGTLTSGVWLSGAHLDHDVLSYPRTPAGPACQGFWAKWILSLGQLEGKHAHWVVVLIK